MSGTFLQVLISSENLSKIEAGKVELYNENFSLPALLEEVADTSRTLVEQKNPDSTLVLRRHGQKRT